MLSVVFLSSHLFALTGLSGDLGVHLSLLPERLGMM